MVKKSKYGEVLQAELEGRRTTSQVKFHMKYHIHDIVGADLVKRYIFLIIILCPQLVLVSKEQVVCSAAL